jgi:hypothetical protein
LPHASVDRLLSFARTKDIRLVSPDVVETDEGLRALIDPELLDAW